MQKTQAEMLHELQAIVEAFGLREARITPIPIGLINRTFLVEEGSALDRRRFVLQWVNPIFAPAVHLDIEAITAHLEAQGMLTPRLLRTSGGELCTRDEQGGVWRLMTYLEGKSLDTVESERVATAAGALVARFHRALSTLAHRFHFSRPGAHDTRAHLDRLERALEERRSHPRYDAVAPVAARILSHARRLEPLPAGLPTRIVHGDLKISNLLFDEGLSEGRAILDLDTMAHLNFPIELGDALRSWTNPTGEDDPEATISSSLFEAAISGYARGARGLLSPEEVGALVLGAETVALELSSRFCADALCEAYFGWDKRRFPSRSEHNRVRALSQLGVATAVSERRAALEAKVREAFAS